VLRPRLGLLTLPLHSIVGARPIWREPLTVHKTLVIVL